MTDPWESFDRAVRASGRLSQEAGLLTDLELLTLLACAFDEERAIERGVLREEADRRARARTGGQGDAQRLIAQLAEDPAPPTSPHKRALKDALLQRLEKDEPHAATPHAQAEPAEAGLGPGAFSALPSREGYRDAP